MPTALAVAFTGGTAAGGVDGFNAQLAQPYSIYSLLTARCDPLIRSAVHYYAARYISSPHFELVDLVSIPTYCNHFFPKALYQTLG